MKKILILILTANMLFAVSCAESVRYFGVWNDNYQFQEINLTCIDGYKFRVLSEIPRRKIIEIEDNKYLKKGKLDEDKKD